MLGKDPIAPRENRSMFRAGWVFWDKSLLPWEKLALCLDQAGSAWSLIIQAPYHFPKM